jgi:hypothetical protein
MSQQALNPYLLNIVPIFNVADPSGGLGSTDLTTAVQAVQTMLDTTNHIASLDAIQPYTDGATIQVAGNMNVVGALSVNGVELGVDANGSNFLYGSNFTVSTGTTGLVLSNTTVSSNSAINFIVGNSSVFQIDGLGRALYDGDGVTSNVNRFWVSSAILHADRGAIGLGGASTMSTIFDVWNGDAYFDKNIHCASNIYCDTLYQYSDERLKSGIRPLTGALSTVCELRGVHYTMSGRPQIGFIAQDVQRVIPEAVSYADSNTLAVDYSRIVPILVEAVKELVAGR